jgi:hypothetical protein
MTLIANDSFGPLGTTGGLAAESADLFEWFRVLFFWQDHVGDR